MTPVKHIHKSMNFDVCRKKDIQRFLKRYTLESGSFQKMKVLHIELLDNILLIAKSCAADENHKSQVFL